MGEIFRCELREGLGKKIPALFTSASMEPNLVIADSTIFGATTLSPMFPSTSASLSNARTVPELVMCREFATTL